MIDRAIKRYKKEGVAGVARAGYEKSLRNVLSRVYSGENIYEFNWEVLIVLDACRTDLMESVAHEYEFIDKVDTIDSIGTMTPEWMRKTFVDKYEREIQRTGYVNGNPNSYKILSERNFAFLDDVWEYAWDQERGLMPPRPITDRAITAINDDRADRYIVHYMQPHEPFIPDLELGGRDSWQRIAGLESGKKEKNIWDTLAKNEVDKDKVWEGYQENLRLVLDDVELLLGAITSNEVIITSDHGNAMGELGITGHPSRTPIEPLRVVPWIETLAKADRDYQPDDWKEIEGKVSEDVEEKLKSLGYV